MAPADVYCLIWLCLAHISSTRYKRYLSFQIWQVKLKLFFHMKLTLLVYSYIYIKITGSTRFRNHSSKSMEFITLKWYNCLLVSTLHFWIPFSWEGIWLAFHIPKFILRIFFFLYMAHLIKFKSKF